MDHEAVAAVYAEIRTKFVARVDVNPRWPGGPSWPDYSAVIIASGPSLTQEQCDQVKQWRTSQDGRRVVVINTTYRRAPWADLLYACDSPWWNHHINEVREKFAGALWTQDAIAKNKYGVNYVASAKLPGLGRRAGVIHQGGNSGYQAINLAWMAGVSRMVLLGFDMRDVGNNTHWHGDHPPLLRRTSPYRMWLPQYDDLAKDLRKERVNVLNCTPGSALRAFPQVALDIALDDRGS